MPSSSTPRHPIGYVARRAGLKPDQIRTWERRHGAISPSRSETQRRLYSDDDLQRILLLRDAVRQGHRIGQLADLSNEELKPLGQGENTLDSGLLDGPWRPSAEATSGTGDRSDSLSLDEALLAVFRLDSAALDRELEKASMQLGRIELLDHFLAPLMKRVGDLYYEGKLRVAHEHLATAAVRAFLEGLRPAFAPDDSAPSLIVTTPTGQHHEIGALLAGATAKSEGWRVTPLGSNLPAEEIATVAAETRARAVALSLTHPHDDPTLPGELRKLRRLLPVGTVLLTGGQATSSYREVLEEIDAISLPDLDALRRTLSELRLAASRSADRP